MTFTLLETKVAIRIDIENLALDPQGATFLLLRMKLDSRDLKGIRFWLARLDYQSTIGPSLPYFSFLLDSGPLLIPLAAQPGWLLGGNPRRILLTLRCPPDHSFEILEARFLNRRME